MCDWDRGFDYVDGSTFDVQTPFPCLGLCAHADPDSGIHVRRCFAAVSSLHMSLGRTSLMSATVSSLLSMLCCRLRVTTEVLSSQARGVEKLT